MLSSRITTINLITGMKNSILLEKEKLSPICDSIESLSKLESLCTHSRKGESNFPLTDRQLNFLNGEEIAQMLS